jgi:hypothetical protein
MEVVKQKAETPSGDRATCSPVLSKIGKLQFKVTKNYKEKY